MIRLMKEDKIMEAAYMLFENNPLSIVCSLVCDHAKQCEGHCVRGIKESPVHISAIEQYISNSCFERLNIDKAPWNGMRAAVIGSGPAGMTIAVILASRGYKVTIFETRNKIGGILRYGIPEFRLPKSILDRYWEKLKELGVYFRPNFSIGQSTSIADLLADGYGAVFIGTGAWRPNRLYIPGETHGNVHYAINYLNNPEAVTLGDRVAVIGGGNSAMDVARTAIRSGSSDVRLYIRGEKENASAEEADYARLDGAVFEYNKSVTRIEDDWIEVHTKTEDGETVEKVPNDNVIIAVSQVPQDRLVNRYRELSLNDRGTLLTNDSGETTMPGVFASGDVVTGARTVVEAVRYSKEIADAMDRYMRGETEEKTEN